MSYGKVKESFWTDKKMLALSDDARMLALYLLTGPHRNLIGCMRVPDGYLLADLRWSQARLTDAIAMLSGCHFICRDDEGWTIILNQLKHDPFKVPNHAKSAIALANQVPQESVVFQHLVPRLKAALEGIGMASAWHVDTIAIPLPSPEPSPAPEPEPAKETPSAGADAPPLTAQSFESLFWATARRTLVTKGAAKDEKRAGGLIGKWLAAIGPPDSKAILLRLLASAEANCQGDFTAYITQAIKDRNNASGKPSQDQRLKSGLARAVAEGDGGRPEGDYPGEPEGNSGEGRGYVRTVDLAGELGPDGEVLFGSSGGPTVRSGGRGAETGADEL